MSKKSKAVPTVTITIPVDRLPEIMMDLGYTYGMRATEDTRIAAEMIAEQCPGNQSHMMFSFGAGYAHGVSICGILQNRNFI